MTEFTRGFFMKCASCGVPYDTAVEMYKVATCIGFAPKRISKMADQTKSVPGGGALQSEAAGRAGRNASGWVARQHGVPKSVSGHLKTTEK